MQKVNKVQSQLQKELDKIDTHIYKGRNLLVRIQEKAKQQSPQINVARIKELENRRRGPLRVLAGHQNT